MLPGRNDLPFLLILSAIVSVMIGLIVWRIFGHWQAGAATAVALWVADYVGLKNILK